MSKVNLETNEIHDFYDSVHVDEKWFFISEASLRMYLAPGEERPERAVTHKSHILKVMFLVATARPRYDVNGICTFDGKIGCWPFVESVVAQRASVNRPAGTLETKNVSVSKAKYREFMIEKVLPAIKEKWPDRERNITIQQDGAPTHIRHDDPAFVVAATLAAGTSHWKLKLPSLPTPTILILRSSDPSKQGSGIMDMPVIPMNSSRKSKRPTRRSTLARLTLAF